MKVLYLDQSGQLGGGEIAILPWLCHARQHALVVLFQDGPFRTTLEEKGVPVQVVLGAGLHNVRRESGVRALFAAFPALLQTRRSLRLLAREFDVLYANSMKALLVAAAIKGRRQPLVWHLRDILSSDHFSLPLRCIAVFFGNHWATTIVANSQATAAAWIGAGGRSEIVKVVHDGVDAQPFDRIGDALAAGLRERFAPAGSLLVGVFSRLAPWKGQLVLLEAASTLPNVHVLVVGSALFGEDAYEATLRERAARSDLDGRVHFLGFRQDIPALMRAVDIVAHTSVSPEPFGLVIVEGMLAGKPVLATRAGGAVEIVENEDAGLLVAPGSVDELRRALERLSADPHFAMHLAASGRHHARTNFTVERMIRGISSALKPLIPTRSERPVTATERDIQASAQ